MKIATHDLKLTGFWGKTFPRALFVLGVIILATVYSMRYTDVHQFYFSYLTSYLFYLSIALGSLFLVLIQYLTRAGWSVVVRRVPEHLMQNLGFMAVLFIPILIGMPELFKWTNPIKVASDHLLQGKQPYLNISFFYIRAVFYFIVWIGLSNLFLRLSARQDLTGDKSITLRLQSYSAVGILLFALTQTFASIDWIMSITPHWFSTMIGVYFFAGSVIASLSMTSLIYIILHRLGYLKGQLKVDHFHDLGKLNYGFVIFWAYIAFSQYFLIWYANIPEETFFFIDHIKGSWRTAGILLVLGHFVLPFFVFMSRHAKRNLFVHGCVACWLLVMHFYDLFWFIMPKIYKLGIQFTFFDGAIFVGMGAAFLGLALMRLSKYSLIPSKDPRLTESLNHKL